MSKELRTARLVTALKNEKQLEKRKLQNSEICTTCTNWNTCILLMKSTSPIHQCEEYELARETMQPIFEHLTGIKFENGEKSIQKIVEKKFRGLCENCDISLSCVLTNQVAGVWHCEEYK
jgi:hypothetical protein